MSLGRTNEEGISGFISALNGSLRLDLEFDGHFHPVPVDNVEQGKSVLVHVWGKNLSDSSQKLGINWRVYDHQNVKVEDYTDWQTGSTGVGNEHHFIGGRFNVDKVGSYGAKGRYYIYAELLVDQTNPTRIAYYSGTLCWTIPSEATPELEIRTTGGEGGDLPGYVLSFPSSVEGKSYWCRNSDKETGLFNPGQQVALYAYPNPGYRFEKFTDQIEGGTDTTSPGMVIMDGDRGVLVHFRKLDLKVLTWHTIGEPEGGNVIIKTPPVSQLSENQYHYYKDTVVEIDCELLPGYKFLKWHGDVRGSPTSAQNTIIMDENHTIRADIGYEEGEHNYPLEVDLPKPGGYVTTDPAPINIDNYFTNGTVGYFPEGVRVMVTAHPFPGWKFDHWSDEIEGGQSGNNPEWVSDAMTEHKAVKCHFEPEGGNGGNGGPPPVTCQTDDDCPMGYVCFNGECVPEGEEEGGGNYTWLLWVGGGIAVVSVLAVVLSQTRKKKPPKKKS
jgi:hypothetical protein